jgi:putative DNA primase/helicase
MTSDAPQRSAWRPVLPVPPAVVAAMPKAHLVRGKPLAIRHYWQEVDGHRQFFGAVYEFDGSDGRRVSLPCTFCEHETGAQEWRWMMWSAPRPMYRAALDAEATADFGARHVVLVWDERAAAALQASLSDDWEVMSWPGGPRAIGKVDWSTIARRKVVIWPDVADARDADGALVPRLRQPSMGVATRIGQTLEGHHGCEVTILAMPECDAAHPAGWNAADLVGSGVDGDALVQWMLDRVVGLTLVRKQPEAKAPSAGGGGGPESDWRDELIRKQNGAYEDCRENVMLSLVHHPMWTGAVGYNTFAGRTESLRRTPWGTGPGEWTTRDDRELGLWLVQRCGVLVRAEGNLSAGVEMAAERASYHPVVDYLESLRWDGIPRLAHWLTDCCGVEDTEYVRRAGTYFLRAMVARVLQPGAQVDHMLVLEGGQGRGKSTALRILAGEWFSDAQLKLGDKDALLGLTNVWLYEVSELDAFSRADVTAVKAFLTTLNDHVRGVYERRVRRRPRQVVMSGTTNQERYLRDMTGNRRFWPVAVGPQVDTDKLTEWRDQLFAEALADVRAGKRWWPTREEEREFFVPAQDLRVISDPWVDELPKRLEQVKYMDQRTWTTAELLSALGVSADKIDSTGQMARRVEQIMHTLGWTRSRERRADGTRPHVYVRPDRAEALPASAEVPL